MSKAKIDWLKAKQDYLDNNTLSLKDVSRRYGISYSRVKKVSMEKGWSQKRRELIEKGKQQIAEKAEESIAEQIRRHKKDAAYIKNIALTEIKKRAENGNLRKENLTILVRMLDISLRELREMFPKNLVIEKSSPEPKGLSSELDEAVNEVIHDVFVRKLRRKEPTPEDNQEYRKKIRKLHKMAEKEGRTE